jgi:ATP synthase protein I
MLRPLSRPIRTVLQWQVIATAGLALAAAWLEGMHGAVSAVAGGSVSLVAGAASALVAARGGAKTAGGILVGALTAEGVKIGLIFVLLPLVLVVYRDVVVLAFFASFLVTVLIFAMAFFVRET